MALIKWEPLREIDDMFDRYIMSMGWPSRRQERITRIWNLQPTGRGCRRKGSDARHTQRRQVH